MVNVEVQEAFRSQSSVSIMWFRLRSELALERKLLKTHRESRPKPDSLTLS